MTVKIKNYNREFDGYMTERQWALKGCLAIDGAKGVELWSNAYCQHSYIYYSSDDIRVASDEELKLYFKEKRKHMYDKKISRKKLSSFLKISHESSLVVIDTETTGLDPHKDELLQVSIIDGVYNKLYDSYFKPYAESWDEAQSVNGISPEMVLNAPKISEKASEISNILCGAKRIIGYNTYFDLNFLKNNGIIIPDDAKIIDLMPIFAQIYGEWNKYRRSYKWQKLTTAADYYGYDWNRLSEGAHNSLADCYATLYVYYNIFKDVL